MYCIGCHGPLGDGHGPAARFLSPPPRDFRQGKFKFSSRRAGEPPTDDDLRRTITQGLHGTAMPGWALLDPHTVNALVDHVKSFATIGRERVTSPPIRLDDDPFRSGDERERAVARGAVIYHGFATCWTCHPSYVDRATLNQHLIAMENPPRDTFRDDLSLSVVTPDANGTVNIAPDFLRDGVRAGSDVKSLYRAIAGGITGTSMPTWIDAMEVPPSPDGHPLVTPHDLWTMAHYVHHLIQQRPRVITSDLSPRFAPRHRPQRIPPPGEAMNRRPAARDSGGVAYFDEPLIESAGRP